MNILTMLTDNPILCAALAITFSLMGVEAWLVRRALREPELRR
ncbi:hypothetical protein AWB74_02931 [Caballeronia arvi]|uniref:Uncharacterized protein n=1 Tax=Caballeronia arvi TaxID=1777135 RepID=A0A158IUS2_9BURK|nr:hypothetical protein [Caballeronia arvi]SAL59820.1 hypothetical protein AWB74_02931 [Caballeronia arvi]